MRSRLVSASALIWLIGLGSSALAPATSKAQTNDECDGVLKYTGRESEIFFTKEMGQRYAAYRYKNTEDASVNATVPVEAIAVLFGGSYKRAKDESTTTFEAWENTLYKAADKVFAPAVMAWLACKEAAHEELKLKARMSDPKTLTISLTPRPGTSIRLTGIVFDDPKAFECKFQGKPVGEHTSIKLPMENSTITCRRKAEALAASGVVVALSTKSYALVFPEMPAAPQKASTSTPAITLTGCGLKLEVPEANYERTVVFDAFTMNTRWWGAHNGVASIHVSVNGHEVVGFRTNRPPNDWDVGSVTAPGVTVVVPAFMPIEVSMFGGVDPDGSCDGLNSSLQVPGLTQRIR